MFERLAAALFGGRSSSAPDTADAQLVAETIEAVVDAVEPRIRHRSRYQQKLDACVRHTIAHLREMARVPLEPVRLTRATWGSDPHTNAFFATADDVPECLGRSRALREFFADPANQAVQEAFGLLGMRKVERTVFAPQLQGDTVRHDVAQVQVSFSDHRLIAPGATLAATRVDVGRRIVQRLAQVALGRIIAVDMKATELQERKAYLAARLRMLKLAADGMEGLVSDPATIAQQIGATEAELARTVEGYIDAKASLATLDGYIGHIDAVLGHPEQHVQLVTVPLRVTRLGVKVEGDASGPVNELDLAELVIGADFRAVIAIVCCPRSEVPPEVSRLAQGERYL